MTGIKRLINFELFMLQSQSRPTIPAIHPAFAACSHLARAAILERRSQHCQERWMV